MRVVKEPVGMCCVTLLQGNAKNVAGLHNLVLWLTLRSVVSYSESHEEGTGCLGTNSVVYLWVMLVVGEIFATVSSDV